jgi:hypothetical protein
MLPDPKGDFFVWLRAVDDVGGRMLTKEAAELLGVTLGRLCRLRREGRTPPRASMRLSGRYILWAATEVDRRVACGVCFPPRGH